MVREECKNNKFETTIYFKIDKESLIAWRQKLVASMLEKNLGFNNKKVKLTHIN